jgi:predicted SnoaL-like aldol condensation-catalyzing enzyme
MAPRRSSSFATGFASQFPDLRIDIKRIVAEDDIVVTHGLLKTSAEDPGTVAADFFRLEDGKIVEHWDVLQPFPDTSANKHPMF